MICEKKKCSVVLYEKNLGCYKIIAFLFIAKHFMPYCFEYDINNRLFPISFWFFLVLVARIHSYRLMRKILEIARLMLEQMIFRPINHRAKIFLLGNIPNLGIAQKTTFKLECLKLANGVVSFFHQSLNQSCIHGFYLKQHKCLLGFFIQLNIVMPFSSLQFGLD